MHSNHITASRERNSSGHVGAQHDQPAETFATTTETIYLAILEVKYSFGVSSISILGQVYQMKGEDLVIGKKLPTVRPCAFKVSVARATFTSAMHGICSASRIHVHCICSIASTVACSLSGWKLERGRRPLPHRGLLEGPKTCGRIRYLPWQIHDLAGGPLLQRAPRCYCHIRYLPSRRPRPCSVVLVSQAEINLWPVATPGRFENRGGYFSPLARPIARDTELPFTGPFQA